MSTRAFQSAADYSEDANLCSLFTHFNSRDLGFHGNAGFEGFGSLVAGENQVTRACLLNIAGTTPKKGKARMKFRNSVLPAICLLVLSFNAAPAQADTFTYSFSGVNSAPGGDGLSVDFQYSSQGPVSGLTQLLESQLISCSNCFISSTIPAVEFNPAGNLTNNVLGVVDIHQIENFFVFPSGAFLNPGTYVSSSPFNSGTLAVAVAPEPTSVVLFLSGISGIVVNSRRRRVSNPRSRTQRPADAAAQEAPALIRPARISAPSSSLSLRG